MKLDRDALQSMARIGIGCFFVFHVFTFGVGGIANTMDAPVAKKLLSDVYPKLYWYLQSIDQTAQNWGFFGFVPNAIVRFTFSTEVDGTSTVIEEYSLTDWPYVGRQTKFNLVRGLAAEETKYSAHLDRYLLQYCKDHDLRNVYLTINKKYAYLPLEETVDQLDWYTWDKQWGTITMNTVYCPS